MSNESTSQTAQQPATALPHRQAVKLAQASAFAHCNDHSYLPQTHEQASTWQPHEWVVAAIHTAALIASLPVVPRFQADVADWMGECFAPSLSSDMTERGDRLLEEVLELLQAHGYDSARVPTLVNYVFGRPVGEPAQEVGGVMVTLAAYCSVAGLSMQVDGQAELDRINQPEVMARIRAKQEAKNALHFDTPLPGSAAQPSPTGQDALAALQQDYDKLLAAFDRQVEAAEQVGGRALQQEDRIEELEEALAARQPTGTVSAHRFIQNHQGLEHTIWMDGDASESEVDAERAGIGRIERAYAAPHVRAAEAVGEIDEGEDGRFVELYPDRELPLGAKVYLVPPAQAVDLGQFRECVELMEWQERGHANPDWPVGNPKKHAEALRLLSLIDSQAVRND